MWMGHEQRKYCHPVPASTVCNNSFLVRLDGQRAGTLKPWIDLGISETAKISSENIVVHENLCTSGFSGVVHLLIYFSTHLPWGTLKRECLNTYEHHQCISFHCRHSVAVVHHRCTVTRLSSIWLMNPFLWVLADMGFHIKVTDFTEDLCRFLLFLLLCFKATVNTVILKLKNLLLLTLYSTRTYHSHPAVVKLINVCRSSSYRRSWLEW